MFPRCGREGGDGDDWRDKGSGETEHPHSDGFVHVHSGVGSYPSSSSPSSSPAVAPSSAACLRALFEVETGAQEVSWNRLAPCIRTGMCDALLLLVALLFLPSSSILPTHPSFIRPSCSSPRSPRATCQPPSFTEENVAVLEADHAAGLLREVWNLADLSSF